MNTLTLNDLALGLDEIFANRLETLRLSAIGRAYEALLDQQREKIAALPAALRQGAPLAAEFTAADQRHDDIGRAVFALTGAYAECPLTPAPLAAAAVRIQSTFIPSLSDVRRSYVDEAAQAKKRLPLLDPHRADLEQFPVAGGKTLFDWVQAFLAQGIELEELLARRTQALDDRGRTEAARLRNATVGILGRLRAALPDALELDPSLPVDLDHRIFAHIDELVRRHARPAPAPAPVTMPGLAPDDAPAGENPV